MIKNEREGAINTVAFVLRIKYSMEGSGERKGRRERERELEIACVCMRERNRNRKGGRCWKYTSQFPVVYPISSFLHSSFSSTLLHIGLHWGIL